MIKIVEKGNRDVVRCNECGCKFSYDKSDTQHGNCENFIGSYDYVVCPQCGTKITVRASLCK